MFRLALVLFVAALPSAAEPLRFVQSGFKAGEAGWTVWQARAENAPATGVAVDPSRGEPGSLVVSGNSRVGGFGGWERAIDGVQPGRWYRFTAYYRAAGVVSESWQIVPRIAWRTADGKRAGQPEYVYRARVEGEWTRVLAEVPAPENAATAVVQLLLTSAPLGRVWWDDIRLEEIPDPGPRNVTFAAIHQRPQKRTGDSQKSVDVFVETIRKVAPKQTDLILLPEGITVVDTGKTVAEVAEPVPGPTTERLSAVARERRTWLAAGIYEREGDTLYNTAVLFDRDGKLAGRYRKVYLPREEYEAGLSPGNDYPVFRTDFGTIGLMICYDVFFPDPARALSVQGAEAIFLPIWGGPEPLAKARAIENQVFLITSGYNHPTYIMDPDGERLAQAPEFGTAAVATIDLNKRYWDSHLGHMRSRRMREQRVDIPTPVPGVWR
ncbi:MAG: carbon-nitrogen hydrolase family protein [Bryobacterales bacterium]|nr:carbon-nitrogen hydrolase family protein [Bryobacterales bacterium]